MPSPATLERSSIGRDRPPLSATGSFGGWPRFMGEVDPIWVFLDSYRFAANAPVYEGWIFLDFLGFSRPNRDFSMGYTGFSCEKFLGRLPWRDRRRSGPARSGP